MYLCYIDESGTSAVPGNTSHFILAGLAIPIEKWKYCDIAVTRIKKKYQILNSEIHTAWMLRAYLAQSKIPDFEKLSHEQRRYEVTKYRNTELLRLQKSNPKLHKQSKKNFKKTEDYIHLTFKERKNFIIDISKEISKWRFSRLFAECIDKIYFNPHKNNGNSIDEQAFEQITSRFETFLKNRSKSKKTDTSKRDKVFGILIHDNNETVAKKHTDLMTRFHERGTLWTQIENIIETPLFVDSKLTSMIQLADLCSYALRRYFENGETYLFEHIFKRADRKYGTLVGIRHFSQQDCTCPACMSRK
jgi:hypothetical protein